MRWAHAGAALAALIGGAVPASAQFFVGRATVGFGHGTGFAFHTHAAGPVFGPAFGPRFLSVYRSGFGYPWGGYYGFSSYGFYPPVIVQPVVVVQPVAFVAPADDLVPAGLNPDDFIVIRPRNRPVPPPPQPAAKAQGRAPPPARVPPPRREVDLGVRPGDLPMEPPPARNARAEAARQMQLGRDTFEAGNYGRAADRFRQAAAVDPADAMPHFLLAQAYLAVGKYYEAVAAIGEGMRLRPDWPAARFQPRDLYGNNLGLFDNHLQTLRQAAEAFPDDASLLFLLGYEQWFDGRRDEARKMFERAARRATDPALAEAFLKS